MSIYDFNNSWKAGMYVRLSRDDGDNEESNSIKNQREMLKDFANNEQDISIYDYYIDDGFSGTNFNRPAFKRLLEDIKNKRINTVIVKDLSRFGRNFLEVGNYLENIFPLLNIRFISINDNIDSFKKELSVLSINVPLKNLMNDQYCQDTSKKIKTANFARKKMGKYVCGGYAPYGYKRDENDNNHLVKDEEVKEIVEMIFEMYLNGESTREIAKKLRELRILTPINYHIYKKRDEVGCDKSEFSNWQSSCVGRMLKSKAYCGDIVQNKSSTKSYRDKTKVYYDKADWITVENTHEAYITREDYQKIIERMNKYAKINKNKRASVSENKYTKLLYCSDCNRILRKKSHYKTKETFYQCSGNIEYGSEYCQKHIIYESKLDELVKASINTNVKLLMKVEKVINLINIERNGASKVSTINEEIEKIRTSISRKNKQKGKVYEQWKLGKITRDEYIKWCEECELLINEDNKRIDELCLELGKNNYKEYDISWVEKFIHIDNLELTRELITFFIEKITIFDNGNVIIKFKFEDELQKALNVIRRNKKQLVGGAVI